MSQVVILDPNSTTDSYFPPNGSTCHAVISDNSDGSRLEKQAYSGESFNSYGTGVSDLPATGIASITNIQPVSRWWLEGHSNPIHAGFRIGGTNYDAFNYTVGVDVDFSPANGTTYTLNPATSLVWTASDVNGLGWWATAGPFGQDGDVIRMSELHFRVTVVLNSPVPVTSAASGINLNSATLNGTLDPNGATATFPVSYYFQWGLTAAYGNVTTTVNGVTGTGAVGVNAGISGLTGATLYHFRLVATTAEGTFNGSDLTFTSGAADTISMSF